MASCEYQFVNKSNNKETDHSFEWKPFLRQLFVCSGVWANTFVFGLGAGAPAVLIPQIRQEANSTAAVSNEMASWITSGSHMSSLAWILLLPFLAEMYGRRLSFIIAAASSLVGFIVFYCSTTVLQILIGELLIGAALGAMSIVSPMIITEYMTPRYRGVFLAMKYASHFWGVWIANTIGTYVHWRNIGTFGILCSAFTMTAVFWPESPDWLATKGQFEKCSDTHRWLKGTSVQSEDELKSRITSEKQAREETVNKRSICRRLIITFKDRQFYRPFCLCLILLLLLAFSGKPICTLYSLVMIKKITHNTSTAYSGMLILDGLTVASAYVGCGLTRVFKRKCFFLVTSFISIVFMLVISLQLYLIKLGIISGNNVLSIVLLSGYSITVSLGPMILAGAIVSELLPLKYKASMLVMVALLGNLFVAIFLKTSLLTFEALGMHGTFLLYGLPSLFFLTLLYKYLPETKDKTQQEIEMCLVTSNAVKKYGRTEVLVKPQTDT